MRTSLNGVDYHQPDNSNGKDGNGEDCLLFHGKMATKVDWNDVPCYLKKREFVCAKKKCPGAELALFPMSIKFLHPFRHL